MPVVNNPSHISVRSAHRASWYLFKTPRSLILLGLSFVAWNVPTLSLAQTLAEPTTVQQAIAPTSLAHATLTQKEVDALSSDQSNTNTPAADTSSSAPMPLSSEASPAETLDTSSTHTPDTKDMLSKDGTSPSSAEQSESSMAPLASDYEHKQGQAADTPDTTLTSPTLAPSSTIMPAPEQNTTAAIIANPPVAEPAVSEPVAPLMPANVTSAPLSMAHATLAGSEIPASSLDNGQPTPAASNTQVIKAVNKDLVAAQKLDTNPNTSLVTDINHDVAKEAAKADTDAQLPVEPQGTKQETNDELNQPLQPSSVANGADMDPKVLESWSEKLELLERENIALRDKLQIKDNDKLSDIKVDAVAQIHENVLRDRVAELEKELDKLHMQQDPNNASDSPKADDLAKAVKDALPPPPPSGKAGPVSAAP